MRLGLDRGDCRGENGRVPMEAAAASQTIAPLHHRPIAPVNFWSVQLRRQFGGRVQRIALDAGLSCPNIDGTRARGGCNFCDASGSLAAYGARRLSLRGQLERGMRHLGKRFRAAKFIAYLQPHTNTHAPVEHLREIFAEILEHPQAVGLALGTRPDCLPDGVLDHLAEIHARKFVWLEIGLQSAHEASLTWMNRAHSVAEWIDAVGRAKARGLFVGTHIILGLPDETREDWHRTAGLIARHRVDGLKIHMLYIDRRARLAAGHERSPLTLLTREQYAAGAVDVLERVPASVAIMRLVSECSAQHLVAPPWLLDKRGTLREIEGEMERRGTWQGRLASAP